MVKLLQINEFSEGIKIIETVWIVRYPSLVRWSAMLISQRFPDGGVVQDRQGIRKKMMESCPGSSKRCQNSFR